MQASHLVCLTREQGHNPSFLRSGLAQRERKEEKLLEVWGQWPSCNGGVFGVQAVQFGTFIPPTHLLTKHPFPLRHDSNSPMVQIFFLYYYFMRQYPALHDLKCQKN